MRGIVWSSICALLLSISSAWGAKPSGVGEERKQVAKLNQFFDYLLNHYIEDIDSESLVENAIRTTLNQLDPHSAYFTAEEVKSINENMEGEFSGVGIEYSIINDTLFVVNTTSGAPAERVGVRANDRIVRVDSTYVIGISRAEVLKLLRGKRGSRVDIEVVRSGVDSLLHFAITRDNIPINTIDAAYLIDPTSGYIKVNSFGENTMREFRDALHTLGNIENLAVDLRGNGGGLLSQAVEMAGFFLPKGSIVVTTEGKEVPTRQLRSTKRGEFKRGNVVIIIDKHSASASEIVAGAIQDWDRGVIVGETSFGKGLVQRQYPLNDGSCLRLTIAQYHTPSGRVIQRPYTRGDKEEYFARQRDDADSLSAPRYKTLHHGRSVYGGGGITPDIKTPSSAKALSDSYQQLLKSGIVNKFTLIFLDKNRASLLTDYPTSKDYIDRFEVSDEMITTMFELAKESNTEAEQIDLQQLKEESQIYIKALIARRLYSSSDFFEVMNSRDTATFEPIKRLFKNWDSESKMIFGK